MNNRNNKKERERLLLSHFLRDAKLTATVISEPEPPDFLLEHEGREIGIELTDTFVSLDNGPLSLQAQESRANSIVAKAHELYMSGRNETRVNV
jgi:hypothetical protein